MKLRVIAGTASVCVIGVGVLFALLQTSPGRIEGERASHEAAQVELEKRVKAAFSRVPVRRLESVSSAEQMRSVFEPLATKAARSAPSGTGSTEGLVTQLSEFFYYRYIGDSPTEYSNWRLRRGYAAVPLDEMVRERLPSRAYQIWTGSPLPPNASLEDAFGRSWTGSVKRPGAHAIGVAEAAGGQVVSFGSFSKGAHKQRTMPGDEIPPELWRGSSGSTVPNWWRYTPSLDEQLNASNKVTYAEVGVLVEFEDARRYPMVFTFIWVPSRNSWMLEYLNLYHKDVEGFVF